MSGVCCQVPEKEKKPHLQGVGGGVGVVWGQGSRWFSCLGGCGCAGW